MMNMVDVSALFKTCMDGEIGKNITGGTIYSYAKCPYMLYCHCFVSEEKKDGLTEYQKFLMEQGQQHEDKYIEKSYPGLTPIKYVDRPDGFLKSLDAFHNGVRILVNTPLFFLKENLAGVTDILERRDEIGSFFGNFHYVVKEVKLAKNIKEYHRLQGAFYNYLLGRIQGYTPSTYWLINRDGEEIAFDYDEIELKNILDDINAIMKGKKKVTPTYGGASWPWESYTDEQALASRDISLVGGVGPSFKEKLSAAGITTVDGLANTPVNKLLAIDGVGQKRALNFNMNSQALVKGTHIKIGSVSFPAKKTEIFLDLEGTPPQVFDDGIVELEYLIGVLICNKGNETYLSFVSKGLDKEEQMAREFLDWLKNQKDFIIYHWHHYERTHLQKICDRYKINDTDQKLLFNNMRDLYKDATSSYIFPTHGNGLKEIAKYLGFRWRREEVDATESITYYLRYIKDPENNKDKLQKIIDYNEDDCRATMLIKTWLEKNK
jgi:uncharacterized protein